MQVGVLIFYNREQSVGKRPRIEQYRYLKILFPFDICTMRALPVCLALCANLASGSPWQGRDLRTCVAEVLGEGADKRVVGPEQSTYTDARMGESIQ